jgi:competence protein ComEC
MNSLLIHFLNVGHGDCTIIEFPDHLTMIDINNSRTLDDQTRKELENKIAKRCRLTETLSLWRTLGLGTPPQIALEMHKEEDRLTDPVDFFIARYGRDRSIFRYIQGHPDMDHMTGLYRLRFEEKIPIVNFWDTHHVIKKPDDAGPEGRFDMRDWGTYLLLRASPTDPKAVFYELNDQLDYFKGDGIRIWAPFTNRPNNDEVSDVNELSYVLAIEFGICRILLGGDAPISVWEDLYERFGHQYPKVNLLKAPHHGRKSGYHWQSVKSMSPDVSIVSVGELLDKHDAFASYEKYSVNGCFSTREQGDLTALCWEDGDVWLYNQEGECIVQTMGSLAALAR